MTPRNIDIIIIGAGPGGYELAAEAHKRGLDVVIVERGDLGGTCLNRGCIPTKALLASAAIIRSAREAATLGIDINGIHPCYNRAVERKNEIVAQLREGVAMALEGVTVIKGDAKFTSSHTVEINGQLYSAPRIVIATGSEPTRLDIPGSNLAITSDELLSQTELPESVAIIGGGVIGMEFACILHEFGVKVSVIEYCKEILPPFDRDIAKRLRTTLTRRGINILVGAAVTEIGNDSINYIQKGKAVSLSTDMVVMAVGRRPVIPQGLAELGIEVTQRGITVDPTTMETTIKGIYAIGDVNGICMLAHAASAQGKRLLGEPVDLDVIPSAVFTMPECAMVGLTEEQCRERGYDIAIGKSLFRANGKAAAIGETDGLVKIIINKNDNLILGCHIMGPHASDLVQSIANVMTAKQPVDIIVKTIHAHPTLSEAIQTAAKSVIFS